MSLAASSPALFEARDPSGYSRPDGMESVDKDLCVKDVLCTAH